MFYLARGVLPARQVLRPVALSKALKVNASHDSHDGHGGHHGHISEERVQQYMPIDKSKVTDPELLKHIEGFEKVIRENYADHPKSPDPYTLDPVKIANDPLHDLHGVDPICWPGRLDEYPVPTEPWEQAYARQQRNFNLALLFTSVLFGTSVAIAWNHPVMKFSFSPPLDITDLNWNPDNDPDIRL